MAVVTDARANGERRAAEHKLKVRDLQAFCRHRDLAVGRETGGLEVDAEGQVGVGGRDDENGSLNSKHFEPPFD
jgi:hypothetical protein